MRVLFYTATGAFLTLAALFAFYALQTPDDAGGAKIVLSIDSSQMPAAQGPGEEQPERDLYAEAAERLKRLETADGKPNAEAEAEDPSGQSLGDPIKTEERFSVATGTRGTVADTDPPDLRGSAAGRQAAQSQPQREQIPAPPPGTALAGLDTDKPLFKTVDKDTAVPAAPQATEDPTLGANGEPKDDLGSVLAALNEKEAPAEVAPPPAAGPPPPLPLRRPPAVSPEKTAALNGWAGTQFTTTEVATPKQVRIAILLRGVGRDERTSSDAVTKLPSAISLGFMPYTGGAQQWAGAARERGHEVIIQLPLEPSDYPLNDPGPETLLAGSSADENASRLGNILERFEGHSGVTNFLGGKLLQSKAALKPILENIKSRGLIYVGEGNNSHAVLRGVAAEIGLRYGGADVMIDSNPDPAAIKKALGRLIAVARKGGSAIGMGYASRSTIEELQAWSQTLAAEGITLVPVGALAQTPGAS